MKLMDGISFRLPHFRHCIKQEMYELEVAIPFTANIIWFGRYPVLDALEYTESVIHVCKTVAHFRTE